MRYWVGLSLLSGLLASASAQQPMRAIQSGVQGGMVNALAADGLIGYYPGEFGNRRPPSRYEIAVGVNAAFTRLEMMTRGLEMRLRRPGLYAKESAEAAAALDDVEATRRAYAGLDVDVEMTRALIRIFGNELTGLGVDPVRSLQVLGRVDGRLAAFANGRVSPPGEALIAFPDIRPDHWATSAILDLKREGVLTGYPSGKFGG